MKTIKEFPREVVEFPDLGIVMPEGCRPSAPVWMPKDAVGSPVPVILEHLPCRKRDGTTARETRTIGPDDPLSAQGETHWTETLARGDWSVRTETFTRMTSDRDRFHLAGQ